MKRLLSLFLGAALFWVTSDAAVYDIYVDGVQVTDANKNDILGNGKISFNSSSYSIIFTGKQITSTADTLIVIGPNCEHSVSITRQSAGSVTISSPSGYSIANHQRWALLIVGSLNIDGIITDTNVGLTNTTLSVYGTDKNGGRAGLISTTPKAGLSINYSTLQQSYIAGFERISYTDSECTTPNVSYNTKTLRYEDAEGNLVDKVDIRSFYTYAKIDNTTKVTSLNCIDPLGDGSLTFVPSTRTFAFNGLYLPESYMNIGSSREESENATLFGSQIVTYNIELLRDNYLQDINAQNYQSVSLYLQGEGSLHLMTNQYDIGGDLYVYKNLTIAGGCHVYVGGGVYSTDNAGVLTINKSYLTLMHGDWIDMDNVVLTGCQVIYPEGAVWDSSLKAFAVNGVEVTDRIEIAPINTAIDGVNADTSNGPAYDLLGRPVDDTYHGIVIQGGKKLVW